MKTCSLCENTKPIDEFNVDNRSRDGHTSRCRSCLNSAEPVNAGTYKLPQAAWLVEREDWQQQGLCRGMNPDMFFPQYGGDPRPAEICQACPVKCQCLDYALRTNQRFGVWGGLTEKERRPLRRRQQGAVA